MLPRVIVGTYLVFAGDFTVGPLIAVGILTGRRWGRLTQLSGTMARWGNVKGALDGARRDLSPPNRRTPPRARTYLRREKLKGQFELAPNVMFRYMRRRRNRTVDIPSDTESSRGSMLPVARGQRSANRRWLKDAQRALMPRTEGRILD